MSRSGTPDPAKERDAHSDFSISVHRLLNEKGYPFHFAVLQHLRSLAEEERVRWVPEVAEFPVELRGEPTHIDIVLSSMDAPIQFVVECKRANPAFSHWCFFRTPAMRHRPGAGAIVVEKLQRSSGQGSVPIYADGARIAYASTTYGVALEARAPNATGDTTTGRGKGAIEEAIAQVFRGLNGLVDYCTIDTGQRKSLERRFFAPVIVTTAKLWTSDADLTGADLTTGEFDPARATLTPCNFLIFQYHLSPKLKHQHPTREFTGKRLGDALDRHYVRSVLIVNATALEPFLRFLTDTIDLDA